MPLVPWSELFSLAAQNGPVDLVKIDIEGAEERIVPCLTREEAARLRFLVVETHGPSARTVVTHHLQTLDFAKLSEVADSGTTHLSFWRAPAAR